MKKDSRNIWYVLDICVFLLVVGINIYLWARMESSRDWIADLTPLQVFIFGLATYRLADILTLEKVTDVLRAPFKDKIIEHHREKWVLSQRGFRGFLGTLLSCPSCMWVWVAMFLFYLYIFYPLAGSIVMIIMALSGLERLFAKIYNFFDNKEQ